jgi:two-component system OmpR family response regulator
MAQEPKLEKLKALLVDDEVEFVTTLAERLQIRGIQARTATDGQQALAMIESERPQVVVLDIMMPGISGLEVLDYIKKNYPNIEVILLTGRGSTKEGIEGMQLGAFDFLMKPVKIEELIPRMLEALKKTQPD